MKPVNELLINWFGGKYIHHLRDNILKLHSHHPFHRQGMDLFGHFGNLMRCSLAISERLTNSLPKADKFSCECSAILKSVSLARTMLAPIFSIDWVISFKVLRISLLNWPVLAASSLTSSATTAKPRPAARLWRLQLRRLKPANQFAW